MNKLLCLVVGALAIAQQTPEAAGQDLTLNIVPAAATLCEAGCPLVCQVMRTFCMPIPGFMMACDTMKTKCDAACAETCQCVTQCGPNCDAFEANCANFNIPIIKGVFCPVLGNSCDVGCVISCPQAALVNVMQSVFSQVTATVQQFMMMLMTQSQQMQVPAVNAF